MEHIEQQTKGKITHNTVIQVNHYFIFWLIAFSSFLQAKLLFAYLFYTSFKFSLFKHKLLLMLPTTVYRLQFNTAFHQMDILQIIFCLSAAVWEGACQVKYP